jgi:hypothetical protein
MPYRTADGTPTDQEGVQFANGALGARFDFLARERQGTTPKPTVALGTGAGTGPTGLTNTGTDSHGNITFTSGTSPASPNATIATLTFANAWVGTNPPIVQVEAKDGGGAAALYYGQCTNTALTIKTVNALTASVPVSFDYVVIGGA